MSMEDKENRYPQSHEELLRLIIDPNATTPVSTLVDRAYSIGIEHGRELERKEALAREVKEAKEINSALARAREEDKEAHRRSFTDG